MQLMEVIKEMQTLKLVAEPYLTEPDTDLGGVVRDAISQGIHMFVACGGDGTISAVSKAMIGTKTILVIFLFLFVIHISSSSKFLMFQL